MERCPARRSTHARVRAVLTALALLGLLTGLTGCGGTDDTAAKQGARTSATSAADRACQDRWAVLADQARAHAREGVDVRSAFADRWNAVTAGIEYYRHTATKDRCGSLLDQRRSAVSALTTQARAALPFDPGARLVTAETLRSVYGTLPGGAKEPAAVTTAFTRLAKQTPTASRDLMPALDELAAADPDDAKATARAMADLTLLSRTSDAYAACLAATATIDTWRKALAKR